MSIFTREQNNFNLKQFNNSRYVQRLSYQIYWILNKGRNIFRSAIVSCRICNATVPTTNVSFFCHLPDKKKEVLQRTHASIKSYSYIRLSLSPYCWQFFLFFSSASAIPAAELTYR